MKKFLKNLFPSLKKESLVSSPNYANAQNLSKAETFIERFREILSDPVNILINRVPNAGYIDDSGNVILHNGNLVPASGPLAYYENFSEILIINRGVHEPLEEYCFQIVLSKLNSKSPIMIELGAYWAHYSMWLKKKFADSQCFMVEPDAKNLACGKNNFDLNGYTGVFINEFVSQTGFQLDSFMNENNISCLDILHSDIQGFELEMLKGGEISLSKKKVNYIFISTHSEQIHLDAIKQLKDFSYRIEVSSNYDSHTTSGDGFILASSPDVNPVFQDFKPLGRIEIANASPEELLNSISDFSI